MELKYINYSVKNNVAEVFINRPEVYGALNKNAKLEIIQSLREANRDENVRCIILGSEGKAFCSGQDLNDRNVQGESVDLGQTLETEWNPLIDAIRESKKLVIGAIGGVAAGAGLSVAMSCDLIIARPTAKFVSGFSGLGLAPDAGSSFTFVKAMGYQRTLEFFLFNKPLMAEDMKNFGLINIIDENYLEIAREKALAITKMAPLSLELIKKNLQQGLELSFKDSMERETHTQRLLGSSNDYKEGLRAFFEKRAPNFSGS